MSGFFAGVWPRGKQNPFTHISKSGLASAGRHTAQINSVLELPPHDLFPEHTGYDRCIAAVTWKHSDSRVACFILPLIQSQIPARIIANCYIYIYIIELQGISWKCCDYIFFWLEHITNESTPAPPPPRLLVISQSAFQHSNRSPFPGKRVACSRCN